MVLAGKMFWSLPRIATTNRWCLAQKDGLQPRILVTEEILHLAVATWRSSLPHMDLVEIKDFKEMTVGTEETEEVEIFEEIKMMAEPTSTRMPNADEVEKEANLVTQLGLHPLPGNSLSLT